MWTETLDSPVARQASRETIACRSLMLTCGLHPHQYDRGEELGADIVTLDVEDSVPPASKPEARRAVLPYFTHPPRPGFTRSLRINSLRSADGLRDVLTLLESGIAPEALMVPKVESAEELLMLEHLVCGRFERLGFLPIIETARGLCAVEEIATATPRVWALVLGTADLATSLGSVMTWEHLAFARYRLLAAAASADVPVIDSPCFDLDGDVGLQAELRKATEMGFAGKCAVHPTQVRAITEAFTPPPSAIARAREILTHTRESGGRICVIDGQMIGPPAVAGARRLLARAGQLHQRDSR